MLLFESKEFEACNVHCDVVEKEGELVLHVKRDLDKVPFDEKHLEDSVDEPTFVKLSNVNFTTGTVQFKMYAALQEPLVFSNSRGFIGLAFHIDSDNKAFESIYLRPTNGRSKNQFARNHTVQYFVYPDYKFKRLRENYPSQYETSASVDINEWIEVRFEIGEGFYEVFFNNEPTSGFVVNQTLGNLHEGGIGFWVDVDTVGYFKDIEVTSHV